VRARFLLYAGRTAAARLRDPAPERGATRFRSRGPEDQKEVRIEETAIQPHTEELVKTGLVDPGPARGQTPEERRMERPTGSA
jgi:hypothetical protein